MSKAEHAKVVADRKASRTPGRPRVRARDALIAAQYRTLEKAAPAILNRLVQGALDVNDPYHEKCLDLVGKRLLPLAFWDELGKQEFKEDGDAANRPMFVINVGTAQMPEAPAAVIVEGVTREREDE